MTIANGSLPDANDILNAFTTSGQSMINASGRTRVYVPINNVSGDRNVYLWLYGEKVGQTANVPDVGTGEHQHSMRYTQNQGTGISGSGSASSVAATLELSYHGWTADDSRAGIGVSDQGTHISVDTAVPMNVEIYIDGVEKTATIGNPNSQPAAQYDSGTADWGPDGTTEWATGKLNLSALITWTAGSPHYIEFKETGGTGGMIRWVIAVNIGGA